MTQPGKSTADLDRVDWDRLGAEIVGAIGMESEGVCLGREALTNTGNKRKSSYLV